MNTATTEITKEIQELADTIDMPMGAISQERYKIAIEIQRNKILKEGLSAIYNILDDIRYNRVT